MEKREEQWSGIYSVTGVGRLTAGDEGVGTNSGKTSCSTKVWQCLLLYFLFYFYSPLVLAITEIGVDWLGSSGQVIGKCPSLLLSRCFLCVHY